MAASPICPTPGDTAGRTGRWCAGRLAEEGRAVVMVLHDLTLALRYAHRAALLGGGHVVQTATPEELYAGEALERVMGVRLGRVETEEGWRYFYR